MWFNHFKQLGSPCCYWPFHIFLFHSGASAHYLTPNLLMNCACSEPSVMVHCLENLLLIIYVAFGPPFFLRQLPGPTMLLWKTSKEVWSTGQELGCDLLLHAEACLNSTASDTTQWFRIPTSVPATTGTSGSGSSTTEFPRPPRPRQDG